MKPICLDFLQITKRYTFLRQAFCILLLFSLVKPTVAQDFDPDSKIYNKAKKALRLWISKNKDPFAKSITYPDKWKNESIIVLYRHHSSDFRHKNYYSFSHIRLKLNDVRAVEKFSIIQFSPRDYLDIKIIKPNGKAERINLKNAVKKEIKLNRPVENQLFAIKELSIALNGLEPGDILDVAMITGHDDFESYLKIDYPTRYFKLDALAPKNVQIIEQSLNGAPKMKVRKVKEGYLYELADSLLDKSEVEIKSIRNLVDPLIRFSAINGKLYKKLGFERKKANVKSSLSERELARFVKQSYKHPNRINDLYYYEFVKTYGYDLKDEEYFLFYYYFLRDRMFSQEISLDIKSTVKADYIMNVLAAHLKKRKIKYRYVLMPSKFKGGQIAMLFNSDLEIGLEVNLPERTYIISHFGPYTQPDRIDKKLEGMNLLAVSRKDSRKGKISEKLFIETSNANSNRLEINLTAKAVSFPDTVQFIQTNTYSGYFSEGFNDFGNDYKKLLDDFSERIRTKKVHSEKYPVLFFANQSNYPLNSSVDFIWSEEQRKASAFVKERNRIRKNEWKSMLQNEYLVYEVDSFYPISNGADPENKEVKFYSQFKVGQVFEHSGNNYILNAGYLLGSLPEVNNLKNRNVRNQPFYNSFNNQIKLTIEIEIPTAMVINNVTKLNSSITTLAGSLNSEAKVVGRKILWDVTLEQSGFEHPTENWKEYIKLTDAINSLTKIQIVSE